MKKMRLLALLLCMALACFGAQAYAEAADAVEIEIDIEETSEPAEVDTVLGTAYDGAVTVYASEVKEDFDANLKAYISYYAQYGYEVDEYDVEFQKSVAQENVQMLLSQKVVDHYAKNNGFEVTAEMEEGYKAEVQTALDSMREYLETYMAYYGYTGEELDKIVEEELSASGYSYQTLYDAAKLKGVLDYIYEMATADTTITEEEAKAAYDAKVAAQKETYANTDAFIDAFMNGEKPLYTPEGMRIVNCIFVEKHEHAEGEEHDHSGANPEDPATLFGKEKADAIVAKLAAGADFAEMANAYSEDGSAGSGTLVEYPVSTGSTSYGEEFMTGAMALANIGDVSGVVENEYGYFILRYAADMTAGAPEFETRKDAETEEALNTKKNEAYSAFIDKIVEEAGIVIGDLTPILNIYVGEDIEAEIAFLTMTAETDLTDMPHGDAIAKLAAGAAVEVLGRIAMDGENYAVVSVPGTQFKGFVNVAGTANMEPDDALKVDNTALVSAVEITAKLPTFVITMEDGSVIYGELYPDVTPETVGNFVTLANSGFYNGLTFHRVIPGFMIQGGDPAGNGTGGPGYAIRGEFANNGVQNDLSHTRGVISMARSSAMDSAGSQFFIMHADGNFLDGDYAGFGTVLGGIEAVDLIASVPTNSSDKPMNDQVMREVFVQTYGQTYAFTKLED